MPIGQQIGGAMNVQPAGTSQDDPMAKIQKLKQMLDAGLITNEDFEKKKNDILSKM